MEPKVSLPPVLAANAASALKLLLGSAATFLIGKGILSPDEQGQFIAVGSGLVIGAATYGWAVYKNHQTAQKLVAAAATGNPEAPVNTPETKAAIVAAIADSNSPITSK